MLVQPYLNFEGRCEEAIEFYRRTLGAEVKMMMRFKESPEPPPPGSAPPGTEDKILHATLRIGDSIVMASDGYCMGKSAFQGISLTLSVKSDEEAQRFYAALADGGQASMPLSKTFFSSSFGMLTDRFGVCWLVIVE